MSFNRLVASNTHILYHPPNSIFAYSQIISQNTENEHLATSISRAAPPPTIWKSERWRGPWRCWWLRCRKKGGDNSVGPCVWKGESLKPLKEALHTLRDSWRLSEIWLCVYVKLYWGFCIIGTKKVCDPFKKRIKIKHKEWERNKGKLQRERKSIQLHK